MFKIRIETSNAAFEGENLEGELARILRDLADDIERNHADWTRRTLRDINGNSVGHAEYED